MIPVQGFFLHRRRGLLLLLMVAGFMVLAGCAKPEKPPLKLNLEIAASGDLNPGPDGQPLSVVLRLYQLKQPGSFMGADFYSLFDKEAAVLGGDLVAREEMTLRPGQVLHLQRTQDPAASYLGILVAYRALERSHWRTGLGLQSGVDNRVRVQVTADRVSALAQ